MKNESTSKITGWVQRMMIVSFLSLLFSPQLFAQKHGPHNGNDSILVCKHSWNGDSAHVAWHDSIGNDSAHAGHDRGHQHPDSGFTWHDSVFDWRHFGHNPSDSGHTWQDSGHAGNDSGRTVPDSGHAFCDSGKGRPDSGFASHDTDGGHHGPPNKGPRRLADRNNTASVNVSVYPNPAVESAVIHIENTSGNVIFRMYESSGRLAMEKVLTNGDFQLDKANLRAGLYFYEINDGNTSVSKGKLIFQ